MSDNDLIARLRNYGHVGTVLEAADRIQALKAELKSVLDRESATYARHDAKVERLEAALVKIKADDTTKEWHYPFDEEVGHFGRIAAAALKGADHD